MTLIVSNVNLDSTGNNIVFVNTSSNSFVLKIGSNFTNINSTAVSVSSGNLVINSTGIYVNSTTAASGSSNLEMQMVVASGSQPNNSLQHNTAYSIAAYGGIGQVFSNVPYVDDTWTLRTTANSTADIYTIYGADKFVSIGSLTPSIQTSTDGITWTNRTPANTLGSYNSIGYGNNVYLIASQGNTTVRTILQRSTDGITWATVTPANTTVAYPGVVGYGAGLYIVGSDIGAVVQYSANGNIWSQANSLNGVSTSSKLSYTYGFGLHVLAGGDIQTSPDGITWTTRTRPIAKTIKGLAFGNNVMVGVCDTGVIIRSTNGIDWTVANTIPRMADAGANFKTVVYNNGFFVASGNKGTDTQPSVYVSKDTYNWVRSVINIDGQDAHYVAYGSGTWLVFVAGSRPYTSNIFTYDATTQFVIPKLPGSGTLQNTYVRFL